MDYCANQVFQAAANVARRGWKVVRLWGVRDNSTCTCHAGINCRTPGKHPAAGADWQLSATDDENLISEWFDYGDANESMRVNVGVLLGAASGIIDVEVDGPEALATLQRYGLDKIDTPTYRASRGEHRIFQYEPDLPDMAVVKVSDLEVRLGGGGKAAQSVMPCSWHQTGIQYQWLPGKSIEDVAPAKLPEEFKRAVRENSRVSGNGVIRKSIASLAQGLRVEAGGRHQWLLGQASDLANNLCSRNWTQEDLNRITHHLLALNAVYCDPPKSVEEVVALARSQFEHYRLKAETRRTRDPLTEYGLEYDLELREWERGTWHVTVVLSDPKIYRLRFPYQGRTVTVNIESHNWGKAETVAALILEASGTINVQDPYPKVWKAIWDGFRAEEDNQVRIVRGLNLKLLDDADEEHPPADSRIWSVQAAWLLNYLRPFSKSEDEDVEPCSDGTPRWIREGDGKHRLYFQWHTLCAQAWQAAKAGSPSQSDTRKLMAILCSITKEKRFPHASRRVGGEAVSYRVWTEKHISALELMTSDDFRPASL